VLRAVDGIVVERQFVIGARNQTRDRNAIGDVIPLAPMRLGPISVTVHPVGVLGATEGAVEAGFRRAAHASVYALVEIRRSPSGRARDGKQRDDQSRHAEANEQDAEVRSNGAGMSGHGNGPP